MIDELFIFDCEVFAYDWLFVFKHKATGEYTVIHNDNEAVMQFMKQEPLLAGFNIDKKNHGMDFFKSLRDTMVEQLAKAKTDLERNNDSLQQKAEQFVTGLMGNKDAKTNGDEFDASVRTYIKSNSMELIDPVGLEKRIEELDSMITAFMTEIDAALSVSNALTTIEITY